MPADDSFVENFHVAVAFFVEDAIGQTGQVMWASSIQNRDAIAGNSFDMIAKLRQRH